MRSLGTAGRPESHRSLNANESNTQDVFHLINFNWIKYVWIHLTLCRRYYDKWCRCFTEWVSAWACHLIKTRKAISDAPLLYSQLFSCVACELPDLTSLILNVQNHKARVDRQSFDLWSPYEVGNWASPGIENSAVACHAVVIVNIFNTFATMAFRC